MYIKKIKKKKEKKPLVSVIIPTYNREKLLPEAIDSVINQTYKNWELIIVDDCSTDNTRQVIDRHKKRLYKKIRYYFTKKNSGNCGATTRNIGIKNSKGEYILILDDDDKICKDLLKKQIKFIERYNDIFFVAVDRTSFPKSNPNFKIIDSPHWEKINNKEYIWNNFDDKSVLMRHSGSLVHKNIYKKVGFFNEKIKYWVDLEMLLRIKLYYKIGLISEKLYYRRIHKNNYSSRKNNDEIDIITIYKSIQKIIKKNNLKKNKKTINILLSHGFFSKGYEFRKFNKLKALYFYLKSMYYNYDPLQLKAIKKLFTPGYYKK